MFEVTDLETKWMDCYNKLPYQYQDIYFQFKYVDLYRKDQEKCVVATYQTAENGIILYSFILSPIEKSTLLNGEKWYDISSAYGYSGPIVYNCTEKEIVWFESLFLDWCIKNNVVAEFIRFHPLYDNEKHFSKNMVISKNRNTVVIDLTLGKGEIWNKEFKGTMRTKIRKAIKLGVDVEISHDLSLFVDIYRETMDRLDAEEQYFFSDRYFESISQFEPESFFVMYAKYQEQAIAAALFFVSGGNLHYHLGGSRKEYQYLRPNNYILYRAMEYGIERNCTKFHLGGGRTVEEDDLLFRYKREFSSMTREFFIGKRIHQKEIYERLIGEWEKEHNKKPTLFLQYRE